MSVGIYTAATPDGLLSQDDVFTKPFAITFDGRLGGYREVKLFIRNDDALKYYTALQLSLEDTNELSVTNRPEDGFIWKLSYGDTKPTYNDWLNTPISNSLTNIDNIGAEGDPDTSTYLPFWVFIQVPPGLDIQVFTGVKFVLTGDEALV
jgi:hypothetical protein